MSLKKLVLGFRIDDKVNGNLSIDRLNTFPHYKPSLHPFLIGL